MKFPGKQAALMVELEPIVYKPLLNVLQKIKWEKVFKSVLSKFFTGCLAENLHSSLLNTLSQMA